MMVSNPILNDKITFKMTLDLLTIPDIDRPLNEDVVDEVRDYRPDYNNRSDCNNRLSTSISFMTSVGNTSDHLHCEFV